MVIMTLSKSFLIASLIMSLPQTQAGKIKKPQKQQDQLRMEKAPNWRENEMNQQFEKDKHIDPYSPKKQKQEERERKLRNEAEDEFEDEIDF
jgi:hypothetical protein